MPEHGTRSSYVGGCRCDPCRRSNSRYVKALAHFGSDLVPADQVQLHIKALREAGMGRHAIASAAGVSSATVNRLLGNVRARPSSRIHAATAERLLGIQIPTR
jgi:transposase-like protein